MQHGGISFTVLMALILSTMFMSVTGGALTPHERRTLGTAFVGVVLGNAEAQERLTADAGAAYFPRPSVRLVPLQPIVLPGPPVDADVALLGGDLLGGPPARAPRRAITLLAAAQPAEQALVDARDAAAPILVAVSQRVAPCADKACALPVARGADMGDIAAIDIVALE